MEQEGLTSHACNLMDIHPLRQVQQASPSLKEIGNMTRPPYKQYFLQRLHHCACCKLLQESPSEIYIEIFFKEIIYEDIASEECVM